MAEVTAGILLKLRDELSSKIKGAGISVSDFGTKAVGVANKVNNAFKGVAGTLGALGVSIGSIAALKTLVDLDDRMARLGLTANLSAKRINEWKRHIFDVARMPDIKISPDKIISALDKTMTATGDYQFSYANTENIARLIQASGAADEDVGKVFGEFANKGLSNEDIAKLLDNMVTQSDMGKFNFIEFAGVAEKTIAAYSQGAAMGVEEFTRMNGAMLVLRSATGSAEVAASTLEATMRDLTDIDKITKLKAMGINVRDNTGKMRDFNEIMIEVAAVAQDFHKSDALNKIFGEQSRRALIAYQSDYAKNIPRLLQLGDTTGTLGRKAAFMANTLKSSLQNLQTSFIALADEKVSGPMQGLVDLMNYFSEDTSRIEKGITAVAGALAGLAAVKLGAGLVSFIANLKGLRSGGIDLSGLSKATGGAGMPVYVTNWGGGPGIGGGLPTPGVGGAGSPVSTGVPMLGAASNAANFTKGALGMGAIAVVTTGITAGVSAYQQNRAIDADTEMTEREKSKAKGGNTGEAIGKTVGTAGGVLAGAAIAGKVGAMIGTAIAPGIGTAIGGAIGLAGGALVGWIGGKIGKKAGEAIGDYAGFRREQEALRNAEHETPGIASAAPAGIAAPQPEQPRNRTLISNDGWNVTEVSQAVRAELRTVSSAPPPAPPVTVDGEIEQRFVIELHDQRPIMRGHYMTRNTTPYRYNAGNAPEVRMRS